MDIFVPHTRGKHKQGRSQSLPTRIDQAFREKTEETVRMQTLALCLIALVGLLITRAYQLRNETHPQVGLTQSRSLDDWSHLEPDEHGAELAREARVWKVYVGESDKWDKELVEGWDKSMDVLLVFAALFSAISSAFLIESSGALKQDPNDVSAAALLVISQALVAATNGNSSANPSTLPQSEQGSTSDFIPPHNAVIVNTLWYMSLSLSIATAFLAMLAKDWCYSFSAHRTGHPRDQAHRRQRRWKLIERWKMQELIVLLPSLMHISLLLFAIGLCVYLWDLNHTAAIPVICIAGSFLLFYIWSSIAASIVEDFPYTTIISRIMRSKYMRALYPTIELFLEALLLIAFLLLVGVYLLYIGLVFGLYAIIRGVSFVLVTVIMFPLMIICPLCCCLNVDSAYNWLIDPFPETLPDPTHSLIDLPPWLFSVIRSRFSSITESLKITEDLTTSLALSWLIQHCETPSAVDIALQAIAGASRRVPKEPLLESQATEQIMRRIVSHGAIDEERSENGLYTRSLEFLGLNCGSELVSEKRRVMGDIEVMVWDLKSKNEREIADLIKDGSFVPSDNNLEAMRIGNSAASQCLNIWRGETKNINRSLYVIAKLLSSHFESSQDKKLHPAAVQSLAIATALHASLAIVPDLSTELVGICMNYCKEVIDQQSNNETAGSTHNCGAGAILIICVLLLGRPSGNILSETARPVSQPRNCILHAIQTLIDISVEDRGFRENIFWIGCSEILSNRSEYGLNQCVSDWEPLELWCSKHVSNFMHKWGAPVAPSWDKDKKVLRLARSNFLKAVTQVYELVAFSRSHNSTPTCLPGPIHTILTIIACGNTVDPSQSQTCNELLSEFGFPRLSEAFIESLEMPTKKSSETALSAIGTTYTQKVQHRARRHFAAVQLWLVLDLLDDTSSDDQQKLKTCIEKELEDSLQFQTRGFDQAKKDLETSIIEGYRHDHRIRDQEADTETRWQSIWNAFKLNHLVGRAGNEPENPILQLGTGRNVLQNTIRSDIEGHRSLDKHLRLYTARAVHRILHKSGFEGNEDLESHIETDFKQLLPCYQRLLPIFSPLPPSRETSQISLTSRAEATSIIHTISDRPVSNMGHIIVEVHDPADTSNAKDGD